MRTLLLLLGFICFPNIYALSLYDNPFEFNAQYQDRGTPLLYLNARMLHLPEGLGVAYFIQHDYGPVREKKALFDRDYNAFAGNPMMNQDPSGHIKIGLCFGLAPASEETEAETVAASIGQEKDSFPSKIAAIYQEVTNRIKFSDSYYMAQNTPFVVEKMSPERIKDYTGKTLEELAEIPDIRTHLLMSFIGDKDEAVLAFTQYLREMEHYQYGNCIDQALYAKTLFRQRGFKASVYSSLNINHALTLVFNHDNTPAWIADPWLGRLTPYEKREEVYGRGFPYVETLGDFNVELTADLPFSF